MVDVVGCQYTGEGGGGRGGLSIYWRGWWWAVNILEKGGLSISWRGWWWAGVQIYDASLVIRLIALINGHASLGY